MFVCYRVGGSNQPKVNFTYDAASRITAINRVDETPTYWPVMSAPVNTAITYDDINRLTGIHHTKSTSPTIAQYTFDYNDASELIEEVSPSGTVDFVYDDDGQLIEANGWRNEDYTFDLNGNRTMTGYVTDDGNRLESDGTYDYTYDGEGNRLTKTTIATGDVVEYTWDYRNRLVEVVHKDGSANVLKTAEFVYDPLDKLIGRLTESDGPGSAPVAELWTVYNGPHAHADFNGSGTLQNRYLYGTAIDMLLARVSSSGNIAWYLTDQQGSVRDIADSGGNVIDHIVYDSFGNIVSESNPSNGDRFKYTAREWEDAIDLYHYRARWYDPAVGRFISQDPLGFQAGDSNLFRYVGNGPTNATDPTGLVVTFKPRDPENQVDKDAAAKAKKAYDAAIINSSKVAKPYLTKIEQEEFETIILVTEGAADVRGGSYEKGVIDMEDLYKLPGTGNTRTPTSVLVHEVIEQNERQKADPKDRNRWDFARQHAYANRVEAAYLDPDLRDYCRQRD